LVVNTDAACAALSAVVTFRQWVTGIMIKVWESESIYPFAMELFTLTCTYPGQQLVITQAVPNGAIPGYNPGKLKP
jgi:hypothetical protein